ncbi:MAG: tetratricopeptide repeat protein, partial [Clostridiales Family XIII bacterium]|nr:tetratricopeptide repeat protein [Clostridiales Family XIII bacterium]
MNAACWAVLNIEQTKDEGDIRSAYLLLLPNVHPEDDPEGFKKLRDAYEAALDYAKRPDEALPENAAPEERAAAELRGLIENFPRRLDEKAWREVLGREEYSGIDLEYKIGEKLLTLLMDDYYIPQKIWRLLGGHFGWSAREEQLKETFPSDYIDYVMNGIRYEKMIRDEFFDLSDPAADFKAFIDRYYEIENALSAGEIEKAGELIEGSAGSLFDHPDYRLLVVRHLDAIEKKDESEALAAELNEKYPNDVRIMVAYGHSLVKNGKPQPALPYFETVLRSLPKHYNARVGVVRCYYDMENYEDAKSAALDLLIEYYFDSYVSSLFHAASEKLIPLYEEQLTSDPDNQDVIYKLASCLFNEGEYERAIALIGPVSPDEAHRAKHAELYFDGIYMTNPDRAAQEDVLLSYLEEWEAHETNRKRLRYVPQKYHSIGKYDSAIEKGEIYLREFPGDPEICVVMANIYRDRGDLGKAYRMLRDGLETDAGHPGLLAEQAHLFEEEGNLGEAVKSAEASLDIFPFSADIRELLMRAYNGTGQYDLVLEQAEKAEEFGAASAEIKLYKASALIARNKEPADQDEAEKLLREALSEEPDNILAMEKLGDLVANKGRPKESFELFERLIELSEHPYYYLSRGWLYANFPEAFGEFPAARARADFAKALELDPGYAPAYYQLGIMAYGDDRMREAAEQFQKTLEFSPDFRGAHYYLTIAYSRLGDIENAVRTADAGLALYEDPDEEGAKSLILKKFAALIQNHRWMDAAAMEESVARADGGALTPGRLADIAVCRYQMRDDAGAESYFRQAASGTAEADILIRYAEFLQYGRRNLAGAIEFFDKALRAENCDGFRTNVLLGKALAAAGQNAKAKKQFKTALSQSKKTKLAGAEPPGTPCNDYLAAECLFGLGKLKKAEGFFLKAIAASQGYSGCPRQFCHAAAFALALLYRKRG